MLSRPHRLLLLILALPLVASCAAAPERIVHAPAPARPQSSFSALVRALEVVDAVRDPRGHVTVRGVECDSIFDRRDHSEYARVLLDVTVYAPEVATAREVFLALESTLVTEASTPNGIDFVPAHRVDRVFRSMEWTSAPVPESSLSYSDAIRVEVLRGHRDLPEEEDAAGGAVLLAGPEGPAEDVKSYVDRIARQSDVGVGDLATDVHVTQSSPGVRDLRLSIRPLSRDAHTTRERIGAFLARLEAESPAARLTHISIGRVSHLIDPTLGERDEKWTFEAVLTVRQSG